MGPCLREILTIIAACLVAVLCAALAIPPFVDWDARRDQIEAQIGAATGGAATIEGPVTLRLLPAPRLAVGALALHRPGLDLVSRAAVFELSPTALLRGKFEFTEASLDRATIALAPDSFDSALVARAGTSVARLTLRDSALKLAGPRPVALDHVDLTATLDSLAGPFRGAGAWRGVRTIGFTFSTGALDNGRLRAKLALEDAAAAIQGEIDGEVFRTQDAPAFSGRATAARAGGKGDRARPPWRASFAVRAAPDAVHAENIEARIGDDDHALTATGSGDYAPGASFDVKLAARNLDLDRFRAAYDAPKPVAAGWAPPMKLALAADSATLGGATLIAPSLALALDAGAPTLATFDSELPGRAHLHYEGAIKLDAAFELAGDARLTLRDPRGLSDWLAPGAPDLARLIAAAPFSRLQIAAQINGDAGAFEARDIAAELDRSRFSGALAWTSAQNGARAKLTARVKSEALDLDGLPQFAALPAFDAGVDLSIALDAQAFRIARFGKASVDAGRIRLRFSRDADSVALEQLAIDNLGGATLAGAGRFGARGGGLDFRLDADRLGDLASLIRRVAPSAASEALFSRAASLSPAHLTLGVTTNARAELAQFSLAGEAGGTKISAQLQPARDDARRIAFFARAEAPESAALLRQIGLPALPLTGLGRGSIEARGDGVIGGPLKTRATLDAAGTRLARRLPWKSASSRMRIKGMTRFPMGGRRFINPQR